MIKTWNGNSGAIGVGGMLAGDGAFTTAIANLGDLNGDGFPEIAYSDFPKLLKQHERKHDGPLTNATGGKAYQARKTTLRTKTLSRALRVGTSQRLATSMEMATRDMIRKRKSSIIDSNGGVLVF